MTPTKKIVDQARERRSLGCQKMHSDVEKLTIHAEKILKIFLAEVRKIVPDTEEKVFLALLQKLTRIAKSVLQKSKVQSRDKLTRQNGGTADKTLDNNDGKRSDVKRGTTGGTGNLGTKHGNNDLSVAFIPDDESEKKVGGCCRSNAEPIAISLKKNSQSTLILPRN